MFINELQTVIHKEDVWIWSGDASKSYTGKSTYLNLMPNTNQSLQFNFDMF